jgi:hypothetical protein
LASTRLNPSYRAALGFAVSDSTRLNPTYDTEPSHGLCGALVTRHP